MPSVGCISQVEMAALDYKASRLVRSVDAATGQRAGFGEGGLTEVVSARCALQVQFDGGVGEQ